jgi:hypothetical protein
MSNKEAALRRYGPERSSWTAKRWTGTSQAQSFCQCRNSHHLSTCDHALGPRGREAVGSTLRSRASTSQSTWMRASARSFRSMGRSRRVRRLRIRVRTAQNGRDLNDRRAAGQKRLDHLGSRRENSHIHHSACLQTAPRIVNTLLEFKRGMQREDVHASTVIPVE